MPKKARSSKWTRKRPEVKNKKPIAIENETIIPPNDFPQTSPSTGSTVSSASTASTTSKEKRPPKKRQRTHLVTTKRRRNVNSQREPLTASSSKFQENFNVDSFLSIIVGNRCQADECFPERSRNKQCTAMAVAALSYATHVNPNSWTASTIDEILQCGDNLYNTSVDKLARPGIDDEIRQLPAAPYLTAIEVDTTVVFENATFQITHQDNSSINGLLNMPSSDSINFPVLLDGLDRLFQNFTTGILTSNLLSFGIFKCNGDIYVFDSHSRNEFGLPCANGRACLVSFEDLVSAHRHLLRCLGSDSTQTANDAYCLSPIVVEQSRHVVRAPLTDIFVAPRPVSYVQTGRRSSRERRDPSSATRAATKTPSRTQRPQRPQHPGAIGLPLPNLFYLGALNVQCGHCRALFFKNENQCCCSKGSVKVLAQAAPYPDLLEQLMTGQHRQSKEFKEHVRRYNTLLAFASTKASEKLFPQSRHRRAPPVYVISGQICHMVADVTRSGHAFGDLYFVDTGEAMNRRLDSNILEGCSAELLRDLDSLLRGCNPYAQLYRSLREVVDDIQRRGEEVQHVGLFFQKNPSRNYDIPITAHEIGAVFSSRDGQVPPRNKVAVYVRQETAQARMTEIENPSPIVDPLCYPLLFPTGELGWSINLPLTICRGKRQRVTMNDYERYRIMQRANTFNPILYAAKLTQQFIVDKYVSVEGDRLKYLSLNQKNLRADTYVGLHDYVSNLAENTDQRAGKVVVLPSTFTGGPRFMQSNYQDAMAIVCKYGKPTLFVTLTCNPNWQEFKENVPVYCNTMDRPDLVARVFELKRKQLFEDILKKRIFGEVIAWVYVIEFQKRGLPHVHCLFTMSDDDKLRDPEDVDRFISAELPDQNKNARLFDIILKTMVHGPCGTSTDHLRRAPCMEDGKCTKGYPKEFVETTKVEPGRFPIYRRRRDDKVITRTVGGHVHDVDNTVVVPYNPYLCAKYDCHINVEVCATVTACKYLFAYINKGPDAAIISVEGELIYDEIKQYIHSRYISASEAAWRLLKIPTQNKSHTIYRLPIHLPGHKTVYFEEGEEAEALTTSAEKMSKLEAFFQLNAEDQEAHRYLYGEIPLHYTYDATTHKWKRRRQAANVITRIYTVSPKCIEQFHLRILLLHVPGPRSYEELLTVDGNRCATFRESASRRFLIDTDNEWSSAMAHARETKMPGAMRRLFAYLLCYCVVNDPAALWHTFANSMSEDFVRRQKCSDAEARNRALSHICEIVRYLGRTPDEFDLPLPAPNAVFDMTDIDGALRDMIEEPSMSAAPDVSLLNEQQLALHARVTQAVRSPEQSQRYFFVQGSGGTGKTYLYNSIIAALASQNTPVLAVAFTGIAALLLTGGRTAHSAFKLPLLTDIGSTSSITAQSGDAEALRRVQLIIWDEISMTSHFVIDCVDRLLQDVRGNSRPFGGVCVLLGGDLKQLLPVASTRVRQLELLFTNCQAWEHFESHTLTTNMRTGPEESQFADWLLALGTGRLGEPLPHTPSEYVIHVPESCVTDDVIDDIYGDIIGVPHSREIIKIMSGRAILCPKNDHCTSINNRLTDMFPGALFTLLSNDSVDTEDEDERANYPEEYLNTVTPSGMPPHKLTLKIGVPVILLRNLSLQDGLINGTRLIVLDVKPTLLTVEIVTGRFSGRQVFIPRMDLTSGDNIFPFTLKRRQFPVRVCFALTINKAQGQTFDKVGIYLESPVFSHGQLYVAFSRVRNRHSVKVQVINAKDQGTLVKNKKKTVYTKNIVCRDVFLPEP